jgi:hypothetical protein
MSEVTTLPPRYILDRWRKDINRKHILIKSSGDMLINNSTAQRYDEFCKHGEELASLTSKNVKYFMEAMKNVDMLMEKYRALMLAEANQCDEVIPTCDEVIPSNEGTTVQGEKVLTPVKATKRGRPRVLRMVPVIEKVTKKSKGKVSVIGKVTKKSQGKKSQGRNKQQSNNIVNKKAKKKKRYVIYLFYLKINHFLNCRLYTNIYYCRIPKQRKMTSTLVKLHCLIQHR